MTLPSPPSIWYSVSDRVPKPADEPNFMPKASHATDDHATDDHASGGTAVRVAARATERPGGGGQVGIRGHHGIRGYQAVPGSQAVITLQRRIEGPDLRGAQ